MNAIKAINNLFVKQLPTRTSLYKDTTHSLVQKKSYKQETKLKKTKYMVFYVNWNTNMNHFTLKDITPFRNY